MSPCFGLWTLHELVDYFFAKVTLIITLLENFLIVFLTTGILLFLLLFFSQRRTILHMFIKVGRFAIFQLSVVPLDFFYGPGFYCFMNRSVSGQYWVSLVYLSTRVGWWVLTSCPLWGTTVSVMSAVLSTQLHSWR